MSSSAPIASTTARPTRDGRSSITARRRVWRRSRVDRRGRPGQRRFGSSVATAGDVNGDGFADVIVGASSLRQRPDRRRAGIRLSRLGGRARRLAAWTAEANQANALFGWSVAAAGDVNGDGYSDVIVGRLRIRQRADQRGAGVRLPRLGGGAGGHPRVDGGERTRPAPPSAARWRRRGT